MRLGLFGFFLYYNLFECPPDNWNSHSMVTVIFTAFGMIATLKFPFLLSIAFVRYAPYSLNIRTGLTGLQAGVLPLIIIMFFGGFDLVVLPTFLTCSSSMWCTIGICLTVTASNIMGCIEQGICHSIFGSWMNEMIENCKAVLTKKNPTIGEIQSILHQYETLEFALEHFLFLLFTSLQIVAILAFSVGIKGKRKHNFHIMHWRLEEGNGGFSDFFSSFF